MSSVIGRITKRGVSHAKSTSTSASSMRSLGKVAVHVSGKTVRVRDANTSERASRR